MFRHILAPNSQLPTNSQALSISLFSKTTQPILATLFMFFNEDKTSNFNQVALSFFHIMMNLEIILYIPSFLVEVNKFHFNHFHLVSYFKYYSMLVYLFMYNHVEKFDYIGLLYNNLSHFQSHTLNCGTLPKMLESDKSCQ